ncbi:MAG: DUF4153 domain-containing protein [Prevotellaceae bacterium]|jgi:hypothetical protein|nr:DUF4153 domain-containing protein [Prevotellaceae bacterium]
MEHAILSTVGRRIQEAFCRFCVPIIVLFGCATTAWIGLYTDAIPVWLIYFCALSVPFTISAAMWAESRQRRSHLFVSIIVLAALLLYCYFLPADIDASDSVTFVQPIVLGGVGVLSIFFMPFIREKDSDVAFRTYAQELIFQALRAAAFGILLYAGLAFSIWIVNTLFNIEPHWEPYGQLAILCFILFTPLCFLFSLPPMDKLIVGEVSIIDKLIDTVSRYILLPIVVLYTLIMYIYLIRIITLWELPNGLVAVPVSVLFIGTLIVIFLQYPVATSNRDNKLSRLLFPFSGFVIVPLLVLMTIGIVQRFSDYGATINRCYVLAFNLWCYGVALYLYLSKARRLVPIVASLVIVLLFTLLLTSLFLM